ncbi:Glutathione S-Transferase Epsilon 5 [Hyalella azteca]|uniref:Glutathione S-Transferase Epsilon 5 n=1 Tax=Hyalella azteca TaxID=294128 RepID=A0A6A0H5Z6_HYAAZ|nr:Glutathione S-Transferase Epsilon 5 [Hyalella azteca]
MFWWPRYLPWMLLVSILPSTAMCRTGTSDAQDRCVVMKRSMESTYQISVK